MGLEMAMDTLAEKLDEKLGQWEAQTALRVRQLVADIIEAADQNTIDIARSRTVEQQVLDLIDESSAG
jgi:hypothetical protein